MTHPYKTLNYQVEGFITTITLNRPEVRNAMNPELLAELLHAFQTVSADDSCRVVIFTGAGKGFCAGADLTAKWDANKGTIEDKLNEVYKPILVTIADMPKPVISAVNGAAAGIGSAFALVCDLTVMAEDAYMLQAFSSIGLIPDGGATWHLLNNVGYKRAYQLSIEAQRLYAPQCLELGLCNTVVESSQLMEHTRAWAKQLSERSPLSLRYTKQALRRVATLSLSEAISYEASLQLLCSESEDFKEGVSAFIEKRPAQFTGQ